MVANPGLTPSDCPSSAAGAESALELSDFAELFGTSPEAISPTCRAMIEAGDFRYRRLVGAGRDRVLVDVLKRLDSDPVSTARPDALDRWEQGWGENLVEYERSGGDERFLVPKYIRPGQPLRLWREYMEAEDDNFELNWYCIFRTWLAETYLTEFDTIFEFGCGSGFNVAALARLLPGKRIVGLDWTQASRDIIESLGKVGSLNVEGRQFNFFEPDEELRIPPNSAILTIGALEQTGPNYRKFIDFLLREKPALCVHIEPICEWYDESNLIDFLAIRFHRQRNYWLGFPDLLRNLQEDGQVEIIKQKRSFFGSMFIEGYSQTIWRPLRR